ncbi:L2 protein [Human papillomavirus 95]|uniref:Minor capsid protein L2 n=1 Tax=Human papillomavirus 95 TaxID=260716 RepID=Q705D4_9PAPI|nr:L2 protein [Human papillomavirus 95]
MNSARRVKRDSVPNLYAKCQLSGDCLPDVKNKVEANTIADRLLRWLGSIIYLGGLGIGTGRGSGGSSGYNPLATPSRVTPSGTLVRPTVPVEGLGPVEIVPVDAVDPAGSSIVPLTDVSVPEVVVDGEGGAIDLGPPEDTGVTSRPPEILTTPDPVSDVSGTNSHPTIISGEDNTIAVLDISPIEPPTKRIALGTRGQSSTPHISVISGSTDIGQSSDINVFVDAQFSGDSIGYTEEIPLQDLNTIQEFEIETPPKTSTPRDTIARAIGRARELYNRRVQQIQTRNPALLAQPSRAIVFGFENPAFDADITQVFQQDLAQVAAAPDPDFADIVTIGRPQFSETESGQIRVSRLGRRGTIQTRSGIQIGQAVHFYYDLSTIDTADAIELSTLGQHSGDQSIVDAMAESSLIDPFATPDTTVAEEQQLLDPQTEDFSNSHLVLTTSNRGSTLTIPTIPPGIGLRIYVDDIGSDLFVSYPESSLIPPGGLPTEPFFPLKPALLTDFYSDFTYYPSLYRKKRKRSDLF